MTPDEPPRILLVEDDPTSRWFLIAALRALPAEVDAADCLAAAIALASTQDYALWMIDARLPDGSGADLLACLRARRPHTPALAHTAANESSVLDELLAAGFAEALVKPLPAAMVQGAARRALGMETGGAGSGSAAYGGKLPVWDDESAIRALNGNRAHVDTLRELFAQELPKGLQAITTAAAQGDTSSIGAELHRLRASCGFVGAARLGAAVQTLQQAPSSPLLLSAFEQAAQDTLSQPSATQSPPSD